MYSNQHLDLSLFTLVKLVCIAHSMLSPFVYMFFSSILCAFCQSKFPSGHKESLITLKNAKFSVIYANISHIFQVICMNCLTTGDCDFESDTCTWTNALSGDDFDWIRRQGGRTGKGPPNDHTTGDRDGNRSNFLKFLYIIYFKTSSV